MQVLIDADNLNVPRLRLLVSALGDAPSGHVVAAGTASALDAVDWPQGVEVLTAHGWQAADMLLAQAYRPDDQPLLLATGDGDFVHLARQHPGSVLLVSSTASRSRAFRGPRISITDPVADGGAELRAWLHRAV